MKTAEIIFLAKTNIYNSLYRYYKDHLRLPESTARWRAKMEIETGSWKDSIEAEARNLAKYRAEEKAILKGGK